jgi:chromosome segregation protein
VKITNLRLSGFKSFVDATEFMIEPGLNGVVGPNGCGKSNLLEAMRWVMGENSAKSMRSSGMDDVIFAGTSGRPSRNMAEVVLVLDNSDRTAPATYNDSDLIEVSRRIEREAGSVYRINGRDVRAKDVQLLFADASTGAHSPALVRQGQIGELISAKPKNRRAILEEAAGITGLHSRRHEAELRLRAAETNITRLDDVVQQIEAQLAGLKRQARQARRYRNLSGLIRKAEAIYLHMRWESATEAVEKTQTNLTETEGTVATQTQNAAEASRAQIAASETLPPLRQTEAEAAAALHRLTVERDGIDAEEARLKEEVAQLEARLDQTVSDLEKEATLAQDARETLARLSSESQHLEDRNENEADALHDLEAVVAERAAALKNAEQSLESLAANLAEIRANRENLTKTTEELRDRAQSLEQELANTVTALEMLAKESLKTEEVQARTRELEAREAAAQILRDDLGQAERNREDAIASEGQARDPLQEADKALSNLKAEAKASRDLLGANDAELWPPLIDALSVKPGYEKALGAALGDDLNAPNDSAAPIHWADLGVAPTSDFSLPPGAQPLAEHVNAPPALARRLAQIGVVTADQAKAIWRSLKPGQRLVTQAGDLWRWDGFAAHADAPTNAAKRLAQKNRLAELEAQCQTMEQQTVSLRDAYHQRRLENEKAAEALTSVRLASRTSDEAVVEARSRLSDAERQAAQHTSKLGALAEAEQRIKTELDQTNQRQRDASNELARDLGEDSLVANIDQTRNRVAELRAANAEARTELEGSTREAERRLARIGEISQEIEAWRGRLDRAEAQIETLDARDKRTREELEAKKDFPEDLARKRASLLDAISQSEQNRNQAADALASAERELHLCDRAVKETQATVSEAREERARIDAQLEGAKERLQEVALRIREVLDCLPEQILEVGEAKESDLDVTLDAIENRIDRLKRERENMGGVNLRAEEEATELEEQLQGITTEREDLEAAIAKLRHGISKLNSEGRERLLDAFERVNANFEKLFTTLFSGGTASLQLVESDDPLEAGLEILARPPGKRLQVMSLLSGGEQALTAISLIFAVFLCNPAPICVLDEVDAPLDDANVERFCNLLDEMRRMTDTRFIVITHHALSMSKMDRLFGVTMAERGVSQLVSVDLEGAEATRAAG